MGTTGIMLLERVEDLHMIRKKTLLFLFVEPADDLASEGMGRIELSHYQHEDPISRTNGP